MTTEQKQGDVPTPAQLAYDASYHFYSFASKASKRSALTRLFGVAAGVGMMLALPGSLAPFIIINGAFILDMVVSRKASIMLSDYFNRVCDIAGPDAEAYLQPIGDHLRDVDSIDFKELDPRRHFKTNPIDLALAGGSLLFAPPLLPMPLASMINKQDRDIFNNIRQAAWEVGSEMTRLHGDKLKTPVPPAPKT